MSEGDVGTWAHCGNKKTHEAHKHSFAMNEGIYTVECNGTISAEAETNFFTVTLKPLEVYVRTYHTLTNFDGEPNDFSNLTDRDREVTKALLRRALAELDE